MMVCIYHYLTQCILFLAGTTIAETFWLLFDSNSTWSFRQRNSSCTSSRPVYRTTYSKGRPCKEQDSTVRWQTTKSSFTASRPWSARRKKQTRDIDDVTDGGSFRAEVPSRAVIWPNKFNQRSTPYVYKALQVPERIPLCFYRWFPLLDHRRSTTIRSFLGFWITWWIVYMTLFVFQRTCLVQ